MFAADDGDCDWDDAYVNDGDGHVDDVSHDDHDVHECHDGHDGLLIIIAIRLAWVVS